MNAPLTQVGIFLVALGGLELCDWALPRNVLGATGNNDAQSAHEPRELGDPLEASVGMTELGVVTWVDGRVDVPVIPTVTLFPQVALLHIAPQARVSAEEWHPFVGGGASWGPDDWHFELSGLYGPPADDIESLAGELEVERDIGGDDDDPSREPTLELEGSATVKHVRWEDGRGPAGSDIVQGFVDLQPVWRPTQRLELRPRGMFFVYDKPLDQATGPRLGSISVLARVGTFAPLALGGLEVGYSFLRWVTPSVSFSEIVYAGQIGNATEALVGARVRIAKGWAGALAGGWLWNRVQGPLVPSDAPLSLPVVRFEISATF